MIFLWASLIASSFACSLIPSIRDASFLVISGKNPPCIMISWTAWESPMRQLLSGPRFKLWRVPRCCFLGQPFRPGMELQLACVTHLASDQSDVFMQDCLKTINKCSSSYRLSISELPRFFDCSKLSKDVMSLTIFVLMTEITRFRPEQQNSCMCCF